jgi:hypothetical protein
MNYKDIPDIISEEEIIKQRENLYKEEKIIEEKIKKHNEEEDKKYCENFVKQFNKNILREDVLSYRISDDRYGSIPCIEEKTKKAGFKNYYSVEFHKQECCEYTGNCSSPDYEERVYTFSRLQQSQQPRQPQQSLFEKFFKNK